jgi:hypothetical protein
MTGSLLQLFGYRLVKYSYLSNNIISTAADTLDHKKENVIRDYGSIVFILLCQD